MKCLTAVALVGLMLSHGRAFMLKKATKALGGYALIKALEPKPPQMVGIMMPMPMMMDPPSTMMDAAKPMPMMEAAKSMSMMEAAKPMSMMEPAKMAMMMGGSSAMMMMDNPMMKAMMKEPSMQQAAKQPMMDAMKMMMTTPSAMNVPGEPSDRQVLAALHAIEHNHAHHHAPRNLHIH